MAQVRVHFSFSDQLGRQGYSSVRCVLDQLNRLGFIRVQFNQSVFQNSWVCQGLINQGVSQNWVDKILVGCIISDDISLNFFWFSQCKLFSEISSLSSILLFEFYFLIFNFPSRQVIKSFYNPILNLIEKFNYVWY